MNDLVVDLSHHNPVTSWHALKSAGVVGVLYKATESDDYTDPTYATAKRKARAAGLLFGAYHFLRPGNMQEQAEHFIDVAGTDLDIYAADHEDEGVSLSKLK